jgi:hypothetical protein
MASLPAFIPLARGSVSCPRDPSTKMPAIPASPMTAADITESPAGNSTSAAYNLISVDPLTGRATLLYQRVQ